MNTPSVTTTCVVLLSVFKASKLKVPLTLFAVIFEKRAVPVKLGELVEKTSVFLDTTPEPEDPRESVVFLVTESKL